MNINLDNNPKKETLSEAQCLFAYYVGQLLVHIYQEGYYCTIGEVYRTTEQAELYAKEGKGIINSKHCKKLAIDITLFMHGESNPCKDDAYKVFGSYWKSLDKRNKWGGDFIKNGKQWPDSYHFEMGK
jgi:hypothetical protein